MTCKIQVSNFKKQLTAFDGRLRPVARARRYRLLCPVARALDRVGDRWALLILRDLHAGPARFSDLLGGLSGIATNTLTDRLQQLVDDGLVERRDEIFGVAVYALTELGERTEALIFELARFGGGLTPDGDLRRPGNLRTIVIPIRVALGRVVPKDLTATVALVVDGESFAIEIHHGRVGMRAGQPAGPADLTLTTSYEPLVALGEGEIEMDAFIAEHAAVDAADGAVAERFVVLFDRAVSEIRDGSAPSPS
jgi:DNA-binding HxlR family transcriptional regulator